jgi:hypothetical protein
MICWGGLVIRITYGGVVVVLHLYSLGQCPELNFDVEKTLNFVTY